MAFSRKKSLRKENSTSEFKWVHRASPECTTACDGGSEEDGMMMERSGSIDSESVSVRSEDYQVLHEGYLNMSVRVEEGEDRNGTMARTLKSLKSSGSFSKSWKKRWCVLSRTQDGVSIFYYNKQSSYTKCDIPLGIFFLEECRKIFTIPGHPKSHLMFAIDFPYRTVHFYPEKEHELTSWLDIFKTSLGLSDTCPSSLPQPPSPQNTLSRRLSKSKTLRLFSSRNAHIEEESVFYTRAVVTTKHATDDVTKQPGSMDTPTIGFLSVMSS